ncbi:hypothetical protein (mitochondrion) [Candida oxycetoniae]|uniref:Reverse transcriptase domain-containing protein n=1 Tax=Candida oxycetoniae TaxID=497107 RepID=S5U4M7_9ASCO|nr:hypothetical protein [Candida oxycetoniae]AGS44313.1 hypothetical protein [Candida oxycetoniae]
MRRCGIFIKLLQSNKYSVNILTPLHLSIMWKHILNIACVEKGQILYMIEITINSGEISKIRIILFKHQLPMLSNKGDRHAINRTLIYYTETGLEGFGNTEINSYCGNTTIKVMSDGSKDIFWNKYITTGFASSSNRYANRGLIVVDSLLKYNRSNILWNRLISAQQRGPVYISDNYCQNLRMYSTRTGSSINVLNKLDSLKTRSKDNPNSIIDRPLYDTFILNKDLLKIACDNLNYFRAPNPSIRRGAKYNMNTSQFNSITLNSISEKRLDKIIYKLRNNSFQFSLVKREMISNTKLNSIYLGSPEDKIVQEVIRMVLEAIYEPIFLDVSHGFRPKRNCHTALKNIFTSFKGCTWWIKWDIKSCIDNISHDKLINILSNKISDKRFIELIRKSLNSGYLYQYRRKTDIINSTQGSIISPILANIYLHQLDIFIINLKNKFDYKGLYTKYDNNYNSSNIHRLHNTVKLRKHVIKDEFNHKLQYIRYLDDWIVAINGSYSITKSILNQISLFCLNELGITISNTKITNTYKESILFLGTYIKHSTTSTYHKTGKYLQRSSDFLIFNAPMDLIKSKLINTGFLAMKDHKHVGISRVSWISLKPQQIIYLANSVIKGYINYYTFVHNRSTIVTYIFYIIKDVVLRTLAHKYSLTTRTKVYSKFGSNIQIFDYNIRNNDNTPKVLATLFNPINNFRTPKAKLNLWNNNYNTNIPALYSNNISLTTIMKAKCLVCLSDYKVNMYHMMKDLKPIKGTFDNLIVKSKCKQVPLCINCHLKYHTDNLTIPCQLCPPPKDSEGSAEY